MSFRSLVSSRSLFSLELTFLPLFPHTGRTYSTLHGCLNSLLQLSLSLVFQFAPSRGSVPLLLCFIRPSLPFVFFATHLLFLRATVLQLTFLLLLAFPHSSYIPSSPSRSFTLLHSTSTPRLQLDALDFRNPLFLLLLSHSLLCELPYLHVLFALAFRLSLSFSPLR